tara:strand:+ start:313 stop:489 length:177 start_codon:yes stop_codon:yes gene_type:complete
MNKVYVLTIHYPYEGTEILGIYSSKRLAGVAKIKAEKADKSRGYNNIEIEEYTVNESI